MVPPMQMAKRILHRMRVSVSIGPKDKKFGGHEAGRKDRVGELTT